MATQQGDSWVISLSGLDNEDKLMAIKVDSNEPGTATISISSFLSKKQSLDNNGIGSFNIKTLTGLDGISVETLKSLLNVYGSDLTGTIADRSNNSTSIKIKITD